MTNFSKLLFLFSVVNYNIVVFPLQAQVDKHQVRTRTEGPFTIGKDHQMTVYAQITHVHLGRNESDGWQDSDTLLVIIDSNKQKLFRQSAITTLGGAETNFGCSQIYIPTIGNVLMCTSSIAPTVAGDGEQFQLFSINSKGKFVPITSRIGQSSYKLVFLDSRTKQRPISIDSSLAYAKPAIEVEFWTGDYEAKVYFQIYPEGFTKTKHRHLFHFDQLPITVDLKYMSRQLHNNKDQENQIILYASPSTDTSRVQNITVKSSSQIKYLYTSYVHGWWLYILIDGHKGYVSSSDCHKLGFPDTDATAVTLGDDY